MATKKKALQAAAGAAGAGEAIYVDDVFSTYLYTGTGSAQDITTGIDSVENDSLIWIKNRSSTSNNILMDTLRGTNYVLFSESTSAQNSGMSSFFTSFNSDGFSVAGTYGGVNASGNNYASWTFRKAPGFFDVVTYTGTGSARTISHNLGCAPGAIFIKCTSVGYGWVAGHKGAGWGYSAALQSTDPFGVNSTTFNNTAPTDSVFSVGTAGGVNQSGQTYVAYLFADGDNAAAQIFGTDGDQAVVKCGSYTGTGATGLEVNLGFEPQWLMVKRSDSSGSWYMIDTMRGMPVGGNDAKLEANDSGAESAGITEGFAPTATGFVLEQTWAGINASGGTYIYIAIRRPHKPAESGSEVYKPFVYTGTGENNKIYTTGINADAMLFFNRPSTSEPPHLVDRMRGFGSRLQTSNTSAEFNETDKIKDVTNTTFNAGSTGSSWNASGVDYVAQIFRRAPGFFDVVCYEGDSTTSQQITHNLAATPELIIVKNRDSAESWSVYASPLGNTKELRLNTELKASTEDIASVAGGIWGTHTDSYFEVGTNGRVGDTFSYIAYLFASQDGISKVFSVTKSSGSNADVNCGFSSGARFVMLKRTDSTGDWYIWDTERGIVAGNDPYLLLNSTAAENTSTDYIDPLSTGFTIVDGGLANGDYIGIAIA